jgi:hypothetical protein
MLVAGGEMDTGVDVNKAYQHGEAKIWGPGSAADIKYHGRLK